MEHSKINPLWPNALRWFLAQNLVKLTPWHFIKEADEMTFAASAFRREDVNNGDIFVFAWRQDRDDFAGIELINKQFTERVICFHPVFGDNPKVSARTWNIVNAAYDNVFDFVAQRVIPDMKDWASDEDAANL
jgi:hypothetical protein